MALNYSFYTHCMLSERGFLVYRPTSSYFFKKNLSHFLSPSPAADIDECAEGSSSCGAHAECVNLPGGHRCRCRSGYELGFDGRTCVGE